MQRLHICFVHGIGQTKPGYSQNMAEKIRQSFSNELKSLLSTNDDYASYLNTVEILWDDILSAKQEELSHILKKDFPTVKSNPLSFFIFGWDFLKSLITKIRTTFASEYIGDILAYRNKIVYKEIHDHILTKINALNTKPPFEEITFVAHSLGTVITSDFIYDRQKEKGISHPHLIFTNFFSMGSPLALFSLHYGRELFKSPLRIESKFGRWINIFDRDDPIAYPLKNLNESYNNVVTKDWAVNTGLFGIAHLHYFNNEIIADKIGKKLALDWIRVNEKIAEQEISKLLKDFDTNY